MQLSTGESKTVVVNIGGYEMLTSNHMSPDCTQPRAQFATQTIETGTQILQECAAAGDLVDQVLMAVVRNPGMAVDVMLAAFHEVTTHSTTDNQLAFLLKLSASYESHMVNCAAGHCVNCMHRCVQPERTEH